MEQKTYNIFLASSNELKDDRLAFGDFIRNLDNIYEKRGIRIKLFKWEDFDAAYNDCRKQGEYNENVITSNMFLSLFSTKGGKYTIEEFNVAVDAYRKNKSPKVYVYCKTLQEGQEETPALKRFKNKLKKELDYFWINYSNQDNLQLHFILQFLQVENSMGSLKLDEGKVKLEETTIAEVKNLPFAANNKDYQRISSELNTLPNEIDNAQKYLAKHPDNDYAQGELQKKQNRYNNLKEEFAQLQQALFETSQRIATMQRENLSDKLRRATEAFELGNMERANTLLDEIAIEAETHHANLEQDRELVHQDIEAFLLQAKTKMAEVNTPIEDRIKEVHAIYVKADQWAKDSALPDDKLDGLLDDYSKFLYKYGKYKEAEHVYLRLISLREGTKGKEDSDTATSYNNIGAVYKSQGDYTKALEYYFKALDIVKKVLGEEHPYTASSYNNIGAVYDSQGDYPKALEYYFKALDIFKKVLGEEHPSTATSCNNIGLTYHSQGDYPKALEYHQKALDIQEKVLGKEHPDTSTSYNNIGLTYHSQGDYPKALEYYFKALDIVKKVLGKEHPDTATSYNNIGQVYYSQGDDPKALEYHFKALDINEKVLGKEHPFTATSYNNIGSVYNDQGEYPKALEYYLKALDIKEKVLGKEHPSTATSYNNIGMTYINLKDYTKALEYYQKALDILEKKLGPDHPNTKTVKKNMEFCQLMEALQDVISKEDLEAFLNEIKP